MKTKLKLKLSKTKLGFDQIEIKACLGLVWLGLLNRFASSILMTNDERDKLILIDFYLLCLVNFMT